MSIKKINFFKLVASGNDFVVILSKERVFKNRLLPALAKKMCAPKYGIGADGLLVLEDSPVADIRMRIFNPDGSEAQMCGNGARCVSLYVHRYIAAASRKITLETKAGIIEAEVKKGNVKIKLTSPKDIKLDIPIILNQKKLKVHFINTGVPHTVVFSAGLDRIDVVGLGRLIRFHKKFLPQGTNVDFVEILSDDKIRIRTYERGVEDETFACGTGAVASAVLFVLRYGVLTRKIKVLTKSKEILKVYFEKEGDKFKNVWLEGKAKVVYQGVYYV